MEWKYEPNISSDLKQNKTTILYDTDDEPSLRMRNNNDSDIETISTRRTLESSEEFATNPSDAVNVLSTLTLTPPQTRSENDVEDNFYVIPPIPRLKPRLSSYQDPTEYRRRREPCMDPSPLEHQLDMEIASGSKLTPPQRRSKKIQEGIDTYLTPSIPRIPSYQSSTKSLRRSEPYLDISFSELQNFSEGHSRKENFANANVSLSESHSETIMNENNEPVLHRSCSNCLKDKDARRKYFYILVALLILPGVIYLGYWFFRPFPDDD